MDKRVVLLEIRRRKQREGRRRGEHKVNQRTTSCLIHYIILVTKYINI